MENWLQIYTFQLFKIKFFWMNTLPIPQLATKKTSQFCWQVLKKGKILTCHEKPLPILFTNLSTNWQVYILENLPKNDQKLAKEKTTLPILLAILSFPFKYFIFPFYRNLPIWSYFLKFEIYGWIFSVKREITCHFIIAKNANKNWDTNLPKLL